ncbi:MAG TPA: hypothetical protein VHE35_01755 [Kofleriaceae bacterium]|nr:hypothetical protein [Kofleriaceae bacterium]
MGALVFLAIVIVVVLVTKAGSPAGQYDRLLSGGVPARGILLRVASTGTKAGTAARRFEVRQVYLDVEVPGQPPYEIAARPYIPMNLVRDVLPGATVELRVDRKRRDRIAIVGPGVGFVQGQLRTT